MPKTCPSCLDNDDDDDVDGDVDEDNDVFAALTMFVDIEERRRSARVSPMFPAGSFFRNISTKILSHRFFHQEYFHQDPFTYSHCLPISSGIFLFLQDFFHKEFLPAGYFSPRNCFFSSKIFSLWIFFAMICRLQEMSLNFTRSLTFCRHGREYFSSHNEKGQNDRSAIWSGRELQAIPVLVQQARRQAGARIRSVFGAGGDNFCF